LEKREEKRSISPVQDGSSDSEIQFDQKRNDIRYQTGVNENTLEAIKMKQKFNEQ
jgi:hypothetical protein